MSDRGGCRFPFGQTNSMEIAPGLGRRFRFDVILREASRASVGASPRATSQWPGPLSCPGWPRQTGAKFRAPSREDARASPNGGRRPPVKRIFDCPEFRRRARWSFAQVGPPMEWVYCR